MQEQGSSMFTTAHVTRWQQHLPRQWQLQVTIDNIFWWHADNSICHGNDSTHHNNDSTIHLCFKKAQPKIWAWWTPMKEKNKLALQGWKLTFLFSETYFQAIIYENKNFELSYVLSR